MYTLLLSNSKLIHEIAGPWSSIILGCLYVTLYDIFYYGWDVVFFTDANTVYCKYAA